MKPVGEAVKGVGVGKARQKYIIEALNFVDALIEGECDEAERKDQ